MRNYLLSTIIAVVLVSPIQAQLYTPGVQKPGPNGTKEQWMHYYDQVLGKTPAPSPLRDTTNFPSCVEIVNRFNGSWTKGLQPIPSTVIDKGVLRNVPYSSYKSGDFEVNVYGNLQNPAGIEIGVYRSLLDNDAAKQHCVEFILSILPNQKSRDILRTLDRRKDSATSDGLTLEFIPPGDADAYGGWWISAYYGARLDTARASDKDLAEITVPKGAPTPASGWSDSDMMFAKTTALSTEVKVASLTIGRDEYKNAYITKRNPAEATIYHSTGVAVYPMEKLGAGLQEQLGFDPKAAQAYRDARVQVTLTSDPTPPEPRVYVRDYQTYIDPRGGVYHYSASGNKVYQKHHKSDTPDQN
jgi:hypothetical protein